MNNKNNIIDYWLESAAHDLDTAQGLFDISKYDWCLFISHLVIEKMLKAHYVNDNNEVAPKTHDLVYLAKKTKINLDYEKIVLLDIIKDFNMEARYPDDKFEFYKKCNKEFAFKNFEIIKELYKWLKSTLIY